MPKFLILRKCAYFILLKCNEKIVVTGWRAQQSSDEEPRNAQTANDALLRKMETFTYVNKAFGLTFLSLIHAVLNGLQQ